MTLEEAQRICHEMIERYGLYCDYHEERRAGAVKFITLTLRFKIDEMPEQGRPKIIDKK